MQKESERTSNQVLKSLVAGIKVDRKQERGENDHYSRSIDFLLRRPGHALHLDSNIGDIVTNTIQRIFSNCNFIGHGDPYSLTAKDCAVASLTRSI
jgi:hypothetical protein